MTCHCIGNLILQNCNAQRKQMQNWLWRLLQTFLTQLTRKLQKYPFCCSCCLPNKAIERLSHIYGFAQVLGQKQIHIAGDTKHDWKNQQECLSKNPVNGVFIIFLATRNKRGGYLVGADGPGSTTSTDKFLGRAVCCLPSWRCRVTWIRDFQKPLALQDC